MNKNDFKYFIIPLILISIPVFTFFTYFKFNSTKNETLNNKLVLEEKPQYYNDNFIELEPKKIKDDLIVQRFINKEKNELLFCISNETIIIKKYDFGNFLTDIKILKLDDYTKYIKQDSLNIISKDSFTKKINYPSYNKQSLYEEGIITLEDDYLKKRIVIFQKIDGISMDIIDY